MSSTKSSVPAVGQSKRQSDALVHNYPAWSPRFWHGMSAGVWFRLLARNRFSIHLTRVPMALAITVFAIGNSALHWLQNLFYGRRIDRVEVRDDPIFIVGHWRSGTTYLHELMVSDERFTYPTTYECFAPNHFLLTDWFVTRWMSFLLPAQRPMDNVATGWNQPQEDEFALCNLGAPTPYLQMAFPNNPPVHQEFLNMQGAAAADVKKWRESLLRFMKLLTLRKTGRMVLKSPPHTGRIETLLELFPNARFLHIVRHPYSIFPSTVRLWKSLYHIQGMQHFHDDAGLHEFVFDSLDRMYAGFERQRESIPPERICDLCYEDLVADPVGQVRRVYEHLNLENFEAVRPALDEHARRSKKYRPNRHDLPEEIRLQIDKRWADYMRRYGYQSQPPAG